jgi:alkylhydroperoxidase family enzyme
MMPKLRVLEAHELDAELQAICEEAERQSGSSASTRVLAHHPGLVKSLRAFRGQLAKEGMLEASLKELVRLKIARLNACRY